MLERVVVLGLVLLLLPAPGAALLDAPLPTYLPHPPILVDGDAGFLLATSGVLNPLAAGTAEDPYVIEGWEITPINTGGPGPVPDLTLPAINIRNTEKHVHIRNNWLHGTEANAIYNTDYVSGIRVTNAANVTIEANLIEGLRTGINVRQARNIIVAGNGISEIEIFSVWLRESTSVTLSGNEISRSHIQTSSGIQAEDSTGLVIRGNSISDHPGAAVLLQNSSGDLLHNHLFNNLRGIFFNPSGPNSLPSYVAFNLVSNNREGVRVDLWPSPNLRLAQNNLERNQIGVHAYGTQPGQPPVDATMNYWGCAQGPGTAGCDTTLGEVEYTPWLEAPVGDAGPQNAGNLRHPDRGRQ